MAVKALVMAGLILGTAYFPAQAFAFDNLTQTSASTQTNTFNGLTPDIYYRNHVGGYFTPSVSESFNSVATPVGFTSIGCTAASDSIHMKVYVDAGSGHTLGTLLGTSADVLGSTLQSLQPVSGGSMIHLNDMATTFTFPSTIALSSGTGYIFVLERTSPQSYPDCYSFGTSNETGYWSDPVTSDTMMTCTYNAGTQCVQGTNMDGSGTRGFHLKSFLAGGAPDVSTHIATVVPANNDTIATSSAATFTVTGYVNPQDYHDGMYVEVKYAPLSAYQASVASPSLLFTTLDFPITASTTFSVSTTSPALTVGQYKMKTTLYTPAAFGLGWVQSILNFFAPDIFYPANPVTSTSTVFTAAHLSGYDIYVASTTAMINAYAASSTISLASCGVWTGFNLGDCIGVLLIPQTGPTLDALTTFKNTFLSYFPWGYLTRFIVILSGSATSTLPTFSVQWPMGSPTNLDTLTYNMDDIINGGRTVLNQTTITQDGKTMNEQDIIEPWVRLFIALSVLFIIIKDLTGMHGGGGRTGKLS